MRITRTHSTPTYYCGKHQPEQTSQMQFMLSPEEVGQLDAWIGQYKREFLDAFSQLLHQATSSYQFMPSEVTAYVNRLERLSSVLGNGRAQGMMVDDSFAPLIRN